MIKIGFVYVFYNYYLPLKRVSDNRRHFSWICFSVNVQQMAEVNLIFKVFIFSFSEQKL